MNDKEYKSFIADLLLQGYVVDSALKKRLIPVDVIFHIQGKDHLTLHAEIISIERDNQNFNIVIEYKEPEKADEYNFLTKFTINKQNIVETNNDTWKVIHAESAGDEDDPEKEYIAYFELQKFHC